MFEMFEPEYLGQRGFVPYRDGKDKFTLQLWDTGKRDADGKTRLRYVLAHNCNPIFRGDDIWCPSNCPVDSDECFGMVLSFLTLRPGDTDAEHFHGYTPEQLDFAEQFGEVLGLEAYYLNHPEDEDEG